MKDELKKRCKKSSMIYSMKQLLKFYNDEIKSNHKTEWIFRGQPEDDPLSSVLEREIRNLNLNLKDAFYIEYSLLDRFKRNLHIYDTSLPRELTTVEYLALMRHWGGPTRLLDFTYSFYAAVFFALENVKSDQTGPAVVWAIDSFWIVKQAMRYCLKLNYKDFMPGKYEKHFIKYFGSEDVEQPLIYHITPDLLNPRLAVQQGTFLCPADIRLSFLENLQNILPEKGDIYKRIKLIRIHKSARKTILRELYRMNITKASLFPDFGGFTESIKTMMLFSTTLEVYKDKWDAVKLIEQKKCDKCGI